MAGSVVEELQEIIDGLVARHPHRSRLADSLTALIREALADEEEMAVDDLCHLVVYYRLPLTRAEFERISNLAERLDSADILATTNLASCIE